MTPEGRPWLMCIGLYSFNIAYHVHYIYDVFILLKNIFSIHHIHTLFLKPIITTSAVLRLECSIDCISGSVNHEQNIFRLFSNCQRFFLRTTNLKKN